MVITVAEASRWDCTVDDIDGYRRLVQQRQAEAYLTVYAAAWVPAGASEAAGCADASRYLVTGLSNGEIRLYSAGQLLVHHQSPGWGLATPLARLKAHEGPCYSLAFAGTGADALLVSGGDDGRVLCWRVAQLLQPATAASPFAAAAGAAAPDNAGGLVRPKADDVSGGLAWPEPLHLKPEADLTASVALRGPAARVVEVNSVAYDSERRVVAAGCGNGVLCCWDLQQGGSAAAMPMPRIAAHERPIIRVAANLADGTIATASRDGTVREWDCRSAKCTDTIPIAGSSQRAGASSAAAGGAQCVAYDNCPGGGSTLVAGGGTGPASHSLLVYSRVARRVTSVSRPSSRPQAIHCLPDRFLVAGSEPILSTYNFLGERTSTARASAASVFALDADEACGLLLVGGCHGHMDALALTTGSKAGTLRKLPTGEQD